MEDEGETCAPQPKEEESNWSSFFSRGFEVNKKVKRKSRLPFPVSQQLRTMRQVLERRRKRLSKLEVRIGVLSRSNGELQRMLTQVQGERDRLIQANGSVSLSLLEGKELNVNFRD